MSRFTLHRLVAAGLLAVAFTGAAAAAPTEDPAVYGAQTDDYAAGKMAIDAKDWKAASDKFAKVVSRDPLNADAYNLLGFSLRWQGQYDEAFAAYGKALKLDPQHKGALNYSGIAYIKTGRLPQAQGQLERLKAVCANCEETAELAKAITDAQATPK